jgi:hypothetical protein
MIDIKCQCIWCKVQFTITVERDDWEMWREGLSAQRAFPYLSADERELLISGTCGKCWDEMFPEE